MEIEYLVDGIFNSLFVLISLIICFYIVSRYFSLKKRDFLYVGIAWMGLVLSYIPHALSFLTFLIFNESLNQVIYLSFYGLIPITVIMWLIAMNHLLDAGKNIILILLSLICISFLIIFYYFLIVNPNLLGEFIDKYHMHMQFTIFTRVFFISMLTLFLLPGFLFSFRCFSSEKSEIRLKGKLLLLGFVSFGVGAFMTSNIDITIIKVIARSILLSSSVEFYCGYILPNWVKKLFLRSN